MQALIRINGEVTEAQAEAIDAIGIALNEFLVAPNETATEKNNELQKLCAKARKIILDIKPKSKKEKK